MRIRYIIPIISRSGLPAACKRRMSKIMKRKSIQLFLAAAAVFAFTAQISSSAPAAPAGPTPPRSVRLYVMDCGLLHSDPTRFQLKREEVANPDLSVACFLIAHPKGTLIWDTGAVPDADWKPIGSPVTAHVVMPDGATRDPVVLKPMKAQLAEIGYSPSDITYLALSHYHYDHTGNANDFAGATWLVQQIERDVMFADKAPGTTQPSTFSALRNSKTVTIKNKDYDVFGDGTVVLKWTPGHTEGHQSLYLKLAKTGPVVLSGDLYHFPEERSLDRVPTFEFNAAQTRASRVALDEFLKKTGAQLWIGHDFDAYAKLKKSPNYYD